MKEQGTLLTQIINNMSSVQKIELLLQILRPEQRPKIIECLRPEDVRTFWPLLLKERRMEIFAAMEPSLKYKYLTAEEYLTPDLKVRLWDNIGK